MKTYHHLIWMPFLGNKMPTMSDNAKKEYVSSFFNEYRKMCFNQTRISEMSYERWVYDSALAYLSRLFI